MSVSVSNKKDVRIDNRSEARMEFHFVAGRAICGVELPLPALSQWCGCVADASLYAQPLSPISLLLTVELQDIQRTLILHKIQSSMFAHNMN